MIDQSKSKRRVPASGINLFQLIYVLIREYEAQHQKSVMNLSLGNPDLIPHEAIRKIKSRFQLKTDYELHTYAEDKNLGGFCEGMVSLFTGLDLTKFPHLRAIPIPGIKTATALLPLACGLHLKERSQSSVVTHLPAYDVMGTWSASYLGGRRIVWPLLSSEKMAMKMSRLKQALARASGLKPDLIFVIRPGNPASCGATEVEWRELIEFCRLQSIRLVNDGAYTTLSQPGKHVALSAVACQYPDLSWAEMFSVSKSMSDPGARLGVMVGSQDLIEDFTLIKGNTESGPVPTLMAAYAELFSDPSLSRQIMTEIYQTYRARLDYLIPTLKRAGFVQACETDAGFFTLWKTPSHVFGVNVRDEASRRGVSTAEAFNRLVIEREGLVGVHFTGQADREGGEGEALIRYAVCTDVLDPIFQERLGEALGRMRLVAH